MLKFKKNKKLKKIKKTKNKKHKTHTKKPEIELYDLAIPFLGIYPEKRKTLFAKDICTPMFIAVLFIRAKTWKQSKYPSDEEWIKKMWDIYTMEY